MRRLLLWALPASCAVAAGAILAAGFSAALSGRLGRPISEVAIPTPTPAPRAPGVLSIMALGDSLTRGAGDTDKGGYPGRVAEALRKRGQKVDVENLGVDGSETTDLLKKISISATRERLRGAHIVLILIASNDLTHAVPALGMVGVDPSAPALERARTNVLEILRLVREVNPNAPIRLLGLYNPFSREGEERRLAREALLRFNTMLEEATFTVPNALVVPTYDLFEERQDRLGADRFHPGPAGYDEIAARVLSTLPAATAAAS